jgi:hypothetical protein
MTKRKSFFRKSFVQKYLNLPRCPVKSGRMIFDLMLDRGKYSGPTGGYLPPVSSMREVLHYLSSVSVQRGVHSRWREGHKEKQL